MPSRDRRWSETQQAVAAHLQVIYPYALPVGSGRQGIDITGTPGTAWEVKARRAFSPAAWVRQAARQAGDDLPVVVLRPDGMGLATVGTWPTMLRLDDLLALITKAGLAEAKPNLTVIRSIIDQEETP